MNPGDLLLHLNPLLLLASLAAGALHLRDGDSEKRLLQRVSLGLLLGSLTASLLLLASYFYRTALEFEYVADYSAVELPLRYKLAGVWAGRDGTLLIWCWATALALNWELWRGSGAGEDSQPHSDAGQQRLLVLFASGILLALATIQLAINPFTHSDPVPTEGRGLNPLLQSPWMTIHPPIVFTAFGFAVLLYAAGLAALAAHGEAWLDVGRRWGRWFWLLTASTLTMGGYWAYTTLGWGGFWAWDPVETSGLLPWLACTTFLHAAVMSKRKRQYSLLGPLLAMLVLLLVLLESFVTRGGIWLSVHAFLPTQSESAAQRFLTVMADDTSVKGLVVLLGSCLAVTGFTTVRAYLRAPATEPRKREKLDEWLDEDTTFFGAIYTQLLILTVALVLLLMGVNGYLPGFVFETRLALFVALLAALFTIYTLQRWYEPRRLLS
ncbi:MAG: cytochrome c biogenesis protein CcsA, partial [Candidatus Thermoplasmatota archaeon]|nr:cytochrome c biogenesis protein CcsA [Candidatus Thermoplasmatota archaeon]